MFPLRTFRRTLPLAAIAALAALFSTPADGQAIPWRADVAQAMTQNSTGKDLFLNFTGSDWCGYCKRLDAEVFAEEGFQASAMKSFVFLFLDFPNGEQAKSKVVDEELCQKLRAQYGVEGFPSILLCDSTGNPYGRTGYLPIGPEKYAVHIEELRSGGEKVKALLANTDPEKQEALLLAAFPVLESQNLLSYPGYSKYLSAAEKLEALAGRVRNHHALKRLAELLSVREGIPDWEQVYEILKENPTLEGPEYLNACWGCATLYLAEAGKFSDAAALLRRILADPSVSENADTKKVIEAKLAEFEK